MIRQHLVAISPTNSQHDNPTNSHESVDTKTNELLKLYQESRKFSKFDKQNSKEIDFSAENSHVSMNIESS